MRSLNASSFRYLTKNICTSAQGVENIHLLKIGAPIKIGLNAMYKETERRTVSKLAYLIPCSVDRFETVDFCRQ
jgi:hypothetical protein